MMNLSIKFISYLSSFLLFAGGVGMTVYSFKQEKKIERKVSVLQNKIKSISSKVDDSEILTEKQWKTIEDAVNNKEQTTKIVQVDNKQATSYNLFYREGTFGDIDEAAKYAKEYNKWVKNRGLPSESQISSVNTFGQFYKPRSDAQYFQSIDWLMSVESDSVYTHSLVSNMPPSFSLTCRGLSIKNAGENNTVSLENQDQLEHFHFLFIYLMYNRSQLGFRKESEFIAFYVAPSVLDALHGANYTKLTFAYNKQATEDLSVPIYDVTFN